MSGPNSSSPPLSLAALAFAFALPRLAVAVRLAIALPLPAVLLPPSLGTALSLILRLLALLGSLLTP